MRAAVILLSLAVWFPRPSFAAECTGAEAELQSVSKALAREDIDQVEHILDSLEKLSPGCPDIVLDRGRVLYLKGEPRGAENAFRQYIELAPADARGYAHLARMLLEQRQYPRADETSALALEKNPDDPGALTLRGEILAMKGQLAEATSLLERACQFDPEDAEANFQLGVVYVKAKRRGDAARHFEKSLATLPGNARAWDYLALNLEPLGETERADEAYRRAEAVNARGRHYDGFLDYNYGRFLAKRNQLREAKEHLDRAVELAPNFRAVWYERAKVNLSLKSYQNARADAEKALSLPDTGVILDLQTYTLLEQIYRRLGENQLANKYAELSRTTPVPVNDSR